MNRKEFESDLALLVASLIPQIGDEYRATEDPSDETPGMSITIGADADGWAYQTGDNSFSGGAYGYASWGIASIYRDSVPADVAAELVSSLDDAHSETLRPLWDAPVYEVSAGRVILRDGARFVSVNRLELNDGSGGHTCDPWEADEFTRDTVRAVNLMHALIAMGLGSDEEVNGADVVDEICRHLS